MTTSPITITADLLDDLQRKAKAAHPQAEWFRIIDMTCHSNVDLPAAKHIAAASPAVVDALVEHIRSLTERLAYIERNYVGSCFNWDDNGMCVLAIKIGDSVPVTRDFTAVISAAIAQEGAENE